MTTTVLINLIISIAPAFVAILASLVSLVKLGKQFTLLKLDVNKSTNTKHYEELNIALAEENAVLRKEIKNLVSAINGVYTKEDTTNVSK